MDGSDWPEHYQELGRKPMDVVNTWLKRYEAGQITKREFYILIRGLYDATSGLMEKAFTQILVDILEDLRRE